MIILESQQACSVGKFILFYHTNLCHNGIIIGIGADNYINIVMGGHLETSMINHCDRAAMSPYKDTCRRSHVRIVFVRHPHHDELYSGTIIVLTW